MNMKAEKDRYIYFKWETSEEFQPYWVRYTIMRNNYMNRFDNDMPEDMQMHIWQSLVDECKAQREKSK